ncbi:phospholipase B1, membrane-associated-like [Temnothorax longispinosus]|uniref:phospholipase B1, membrane-associated-like n=1 Tax=Temnothorax longispinosus TaxID=300112 RepID=UPI003A9907C3
MWKWWQFYCALLHISVLASDRKTVLDTPFNIMLHRAIREWTFNAFGKTGIEERYLQPARNANKTQEIIPDNVPFPCNVTGGRSSKVPESVHKLRPGDIDVIATMGDSLMAGAGIFADNLFQILIENRGVTMTGGGQGTWRQYLTVPNIIKEFNPNLIGYALGDSLTTDKASQLNVAESGAMSADMVYMADMLVKKIKNDPRIDLQKHWKFISLMIGSNDFCSKICWIPSPWSVLETHKTDLLQALRTLRDNLPRTFVALLPPPHLKAMVEIREEKPSLNCFLGTKFVCSCMFGLTSWRFRSMYYDIIQQWQKLDMEIATYSEFQRDDFTVVTQPILVNFSIPFASNGYTDMTYLSRDCLHVSQKTNAFLANSLWNNLFEPVGAKSTRWNNNKFRCPTQEKPYLTTMLNSKQQSVTETAATIRTRNIGT